MFESYLTDLLTTYAGHLVQGFDADKARISFYKGEIILKDVYLKHDALDHVFKIRRAVDSSSGSQNNDNEAASTVMNDELCPFEITFGHVGHLEMHGIWKLLSRNSNGRQQPRQQQQQEEEETTATTPSEGSPAEAAAGSLILSDVNILITPRRRRRRRQSTTAAVVQQDTTTATAAANCHDDSTEPKEEGERAQHAYAGNDAEDNEVDDNEKVVRDKEREVQSALDAQLLSRVQEQSTSADTGSNKRDHRWQWLIDRLIKFLSNLSVTVKNIHIRYEDPGSSMGFVWHSDENGEDDHHHDHHEDTDENHHLLLPRNGQQQQQQPHPLSLSMPLHAATATASSPFGGGNGLGRSRHEHRHHHHRHSHAQISGRYRPSFAVGLTLQQFSIQTASAPPPSPTPQASIVAAEAAVGTTMPSPRPSATTTTNNPPSEAAATNDITTHRRRRPQQLLLDTDRLAQEGQQRGGEEEEEETATTLGTMEDQASPTFGASSVNNDAPSTIASDTVAEGERAPTHEREQRGNRTTTASTTGATMGSQASPRIRHKIAAAEQLAAYWDSGSHIMSSSASSLTVEGMRREYYEAAFLLLNNNNESDGGAARPSALASTSRNNDNRLPQSLLPDPSDFPTQHSFLLDPFSPSIKLSFAAGAKSDGRQLDGTPRSSTTNSGANPASPLPHTDDDQLSVPTRTGVTVGTGAANGIAITRKPPPSTMEIDLPPCHFTISRSLLEDVAYIRKCTAVWVQNRAGALSEKSFHKLTRLRPRRSPTEDPRGWWKYAAEAVLSVQQIGRYAGNGGGAVAEDGLPVASHMRRRRGWLGLAQALGRRKRYIELYKTLLVSKKKQEQLGVHSALLDMERNLLVDEIVAFRILAYDAMRDEFPVDSLSDECIQEDVPKAQSRWQWIGVGRAASSVKDGTSAVDTLAVDKAKDDLSLTLEDRIRMFAEIARALGQENADIAASSQDGVNESASFDTRTSSILKDGRNSVTWEAVLTCPELSLLVNDRRSHTALPFDPAPAVVRLSCAFMQEHHLYRDGSWDLTSRIGSLIVKDCTFVKDEGKYQCALFPNLIGPKEGEPSSSDPALHLNGVTYQQSIGVRIRRSLCSDREHRSVTTTEVRVGGLEVVYSTSPVVALSRILATANPELVDDYHRMAARLFAWRERQKKRLFRALAHKRKSIIVDIDIDAPVFLVPERNRRDGPVLVVDLGRLRFRNAREQISNKSETFDDQWRLDLTGIAALMRAGQAQQTQQVVEPFSLSFAISTKFRDEDGEDDDHATSVQILATLPRLVFNLTSSAVRLLGRLRRQWKERKQEQHRLSLRSSRLFADALPHPAKPRLLLSSFTAKSPTRAQTTGASIRRVEFRCKAPLLIFKFENDVDGRDCRTNGPTASGTTRLVDVAFRGTEGRVYSETSLGHSVLECSAKLRALDAVDLYQNAGDEYAFLLSSLPPEMAVSARSNRDARHFDKHLPDTDLVSFAYKSVGDAGQSDSVNGDFCSETASQPDNLLIKFHELYVEWNPETLAAFHKAMKPSTDSVGADESFCSSDDEEFYDAEEEDFYDAEAAGSDTDSHLISEISSSPKSSCSDFTPVAQSGAASPPGIHSPLSRFLTPLPIGVASPWSALRSQPPSPPRVQPALLRKGVEVVFELSKLRVNFNKESRHRRLMSAEMDATTVRYTTKCTGGSRTHATIGNLTFSDAESTRGKTLYREILGLKTNDQTSGETPTSLFEMEMIVNPRSRRYVSFDDNTDSATADRDGVDVDIDAGRVLGFDFSIRVRFSPMRFVYLQQLWFEVVDYFFEGIVGYEVWGKKRPVPAPVDCDEFAGADRMTFTRFDIVMESPVILFPVTYCSTDYIRMEAKTLSLANFYKCSTRRGQRPESATTDTANAKQWFNNCVVSLESLKLFNWSGDELTRRDGSTGVKLTLNWPSGPAAFLNVPKWHVEGGFEALRVTLRPDDYALLQNIVRNNISEESRNLDEWDAIQSLPPLVLERYKEDIMVHFGYDKKDCAPTTFDMTLRLPNLVFAFHDDGHNELATLSCTDLAWTYKKGTDRVSRQKVICNLRVDGPRETGAVHMLSSWKNLDGDVGPSIPDLTYTSTTQPSGDNEKILHIVDANINVAYQIWRRWALFFQDLPEPSYCSPSEVIQVGDRFYKIGDHSTAPRARVSSHPRLSWIASHDFRSSPAPNRKTRGRNPSYQFRMSLKRPRLALSSESSSLVVSLGGFDFSHHGDTKLINRSFGLTGVEIWTTGADRRETRTEDQSLILPWTVTGSTRRCSGRLPCECENHGFSITMGPLKARVSSSDISIAVDVYLGLLQDIREFGASRANSQTVSGGGASAETHNEDTSAPKELVYDADWEGVQVSLVDDTGYHFAAAQELVRISVGYVDFLRRESVENLSSGSGWSSEPSEVGKGAGTKESTQLCIASLDVVDCLQPETSPFSTIASFRPSSLEADEGDAVCANPRQDDRWLRERGSDGFGLKETPDENPPSVIGMNTQYAIELSKAVDASSRLYGVQLHSIELQYNPSLVVALRRFFDLLAKEAHQKFARMFSTGTRCRSPRASPQGPDTKTIKGTVTVDCLLIWLNKEHLARRLLETTLSNFHIGLVRSGSGQSLEGHLGGISATDADTNEACHLLESNTPIVKGTNDGEHVMKFRYRSFDQGVLSPSFREECPAWVLAELNRDHGQGIDEFIDLQISQVEVVFLRKRTEELIDYIQKNGVRCKGEGSTSLDETFPSNRGTKKSFLNVSIGPPRIVVPIDEGSDSGAALSLGALDLQSWTIEERAEEKRMVNMSLSGVTGLVYNGCDESEFLSNVDMKIEGDMTTSVISISSALSDVHIRLPYTSYVTLLCTLTGNVARKIDKSNWDGLELSWDETKSDAGGMPEHQPSTNDELHAPRYGLAATTNEKDTYQARKIDLQLRYDDFSAVLTRDNLIDEGGNESELCDYDMTLVCGRGFEAYFCSDDNADVAMGMSLNKIYVFDLGARGRMLRKGIKAGEEIPPSLSVLVEGYSPPEKRDGPPESSSDSQFVVSINRNASSNSETKVGLVLNFLSIAVMQSPLQDLHGFFSCSWPTPVLKRASTLLRAVSVESHIGDETSDDHSASLCRSMGDRSESAVHTENIEVSVGSSIEPNATQRRQSHVQVRFVLHYPRFIFVADETDPHSRALVLRGLAIVNASLTKTIPDDKRARSERNDENEIHVNSDLQNLSSYIHPDVSNTLGLHQLHVGMLFDVASKMDIANSVRDDDSPENSNDSGVALLLPLTMGVEFKQTNRGCAPTTRSLSVHVDPLSLRVSSEDVKLIEMVVSKWSLKRKAVKTESQTLFMYDVLFSSERLGLGLRKEGDTIVVESIADSSRHGSIEVGDSVYSVNGTVVVADTLSDMVSRLSVLPRPLTITFARTLDAGDKVGAANHLDTNFFKGSVDDASVSLSSATFTITDKDIPLVRGMLSASELSAHLARTSDTILRLTLSSTIGMDYYNLRSWGWEPLLESGWFALSSDYLDPHRGPKEVAVEIGDKMKGPFCLNLTDAAAEILARIVSLGQTPDSEEDLKDPLMDDELLLDDSRRGSVKEKRLVSRKAANAALQFAQRQKQETAKPFVFRNRTGLSVAFVRQRRSDVLTRRESSASLKGMQVGEYHGLQGYSSSEITVVANGEESVFGVDITPDTVVGLQDAASSDGEEVSAPFLTVSLQAVAGITVDPIKDLQLLRPEESIRRLTYHDSDINSGNDDENEQWVAWLVEQADERTVLTLGGTLRVLSLSMSQTFELGVEVAVDRNHAYDDLLVKAVGTARFGEPFHLPLWLGLKDASVAWRCSIRPEGHYKFAPLFLCSPDGKVDFGVESGKYVECRPNNDDKSSVWLAATQQEDGGLCTITVDCGLSLCNMLPTTVEWEVAGSDTSLKERVLDGSTARRASFFEKAKDIELTSGSCAESFINGASPLRARFRLKKNAEWSTWSPLDAPTAVIDAGPDQEDYHDIQPVAAYVLLEDPFGIHLILGIRIAPKICGIEATLFADFWLANCTSLSLAFGCPENQVLEWNGKEDDDKTSLQLSAAEAAFKEITSLFESGQEGTGLRQEDSSRALASNDLVRLPAQSAAAITEECFEYVEIEGTRRIRHWYASEFPWSVRKDITRIEEDGPDWQWLDKTWRIDFSGSLSDGWESSPNFAEFSGVRVFSSSHRYRRRRWYRTRDTRLSASFVDGVTAFHHPTKRFIKSKSRNGKPEPTNTRIAVQVNGGKWALTSKIPSQGTLYGAVRVCGTRWPRSLARGRAAGGDDAVRADAYELCYSVTPLDDSTWGALSRLLLFHHRFLLRNDSAAVSFDVKQSGARDSSAVSILPGQTLPFHWADFRLPQLVSVRPAMQIKGRCIYRWSGGFDPLTIGAVPLRVRMAQGVDASLLDATSSQPSIRSIKLECEIRSKTGGTGIDLRLQEEEENGDGALFRIENASTFPIWFAQDGVLANPSTSDGVRMDGDLLQPSDRLCFGLDVPFRQGKYSHRKAATISELLKLRLSLAPLSSRPGIETTKVVSLANVGERVRLNPSKIMFLQPKLRQMLQHVRVVGFVANDGPSRVLKLCLMEKNIPESVFGTPFIDELPPSIQLPAFGYDIVSSAVETQRLRNAGSLLTEEEAVKCCVFEPSPQPATTEESLRQESEQRDRDFIVSFRMEFSGFIVSLIDSAPSEIALLSFRNINSLATWDTQRTTDSTVYLTIESFQVDNMLPNSPFPVAVSADDSRGADSSEDNGAGESKAPMLVVGVSFAPRHKTGIVCLKSVTIAPHNLAIRVDLAFLVRLQQFALDFQGHFHDEHPWGVKVPEVPDVLLRMRELEAAGASTTGRQKYYFGGLTILPCNIKLSVAPARALTAPQAALEGGTAAAIHRAVRKGDVRLYGGGSLFGVKVGHRNATPLAVVRGVFKSIVVDALLRLDGASLNFAGVFLRNHTSTGSQLGTQVGAHYMSSLLQNVPALLGSLAAFGNPLGLVKGLGDGVSDFVLEPVRGFQRSVQEMDASYLVDGVARGTVSLARHTVGGFADSAAMLAETFSKNMTVLTLDRRYAQKRDRGETLRDLEGNMNVALGLGSGVQKLVHGFLDGVTGVVKAPIRGAEKRGFEGFAKGIGKGLLGLLVKPLIGFSDGITDVMIGVKGSVGRASGSPEELTRQIRPRRPMYGRDRIVQPYDVADAAAAALMQRSRLAGENYLSHMDMGDCVALLSVRRLLLLGSQGEELLVLKFKHIDSLEARSIEQTDGTIGWAIIVVLNTPRSNGSDVEVIPCKEQGLASELCAQIEKGVRQMANEVAVERSRRPDDRD